MSVATMFNFDVAVVVLLAVIMLLLFLILGFVLFGPGCLVCHCGRKKHAPHVYEAIDYMEAEEDNCVTQVLKIRVSPVCGKTIQQEMLLRVQVEAIPLPSGRQGLASTSRKGSLLSNKPKLINLKEVPNETLGFSHVDLQDTRPTPPPRSPSVKMPVTPMMIKDPSLLLRRSSEEKHVAIVHSETNQETSGYLQPSTLKIKQERNTERDKEIIAEMQY